jgi:hypothetical protein
VIGQGRQEFGLFESTNNLVLSFLKATLRIGTSLFVTMDVFVVDGASDRLPVDR